jgi:hypothetical protein
MGKLLWERLGHNYRCAKSGTGVRLDEVFRFQKAAETLSIVVTMVGPTLMSHTP